MDTATVLREMEKLPKEQQIDFAMEVWEHALDSGAAPALTDEQKADMEMRVAELDANPDDVFTWEETKQYLRRSR